MGLLHDAGLADFYAQDVHGLNALLDAMSQRGMPVDLNKREAAARELTKQREAIMAKIQQVIPPECCPTKVYKREPKETYTHLHCELREQQVKDWVCSSCLAEAHTKRALCKLHAPDCLQRDLVREARVIAVPVWIVTYPFVISPKGLLIYFKFKGYTLPTKKDKQTGRTKQTTDEAAILRMALKYEADPILSLVLEYRDVEKQMGTYVGRPLNVA